MKNEKIACYHQGNLYSIEQATDVGIFFLPSVGVNPQPKLLHVLVSSPVCDSSINGYDFRGKKIMCIDLMRSLWI